MLRSSWAVWLSLRTCVFPSSTDSSWFNVIMATHGVVADVKIRSWFIVNLTMAAFSAFPSFFSHDLCALTVLPYWHLSTDEQDIGNQGEQDMY